jgi:hypothetical protein
MSARKQAVHQPARMRVSYDPEADAASVKLIDATTIFSE